MSRGKRNVISILMLILVIGSIGATFYFANANAKEKREERKKSMAEKFKDMPNFKPGGFKGNDDTKQNTDTNKDKSNTDADNKDMPNFKPGEFDGNAPSFDGKEPPSFDGKEPPSFDGKEPPNFDGKEPPNFDGKEPPNFDGERPNFKPGEFDGENKEGHRPFHMSGDGKHQKDENFIKTLFDETFDIMYYILFAVEGVLFALIVLFLIFSGFNRKDIRQTFYKKSTIVVYVILALVVGSATCCGSIYGTKEYFRKSMHRERPDFKKIKENKDKDLSNGDKLQQNDNVNNDTNNAADTNKTNTNNKTNTDNNNKNNKTDINKTNTNKTNTNKTNTNKINNKTITNTSKNSINNTNQINNKIR